MTWLLKQAAVAAFLSISLAQAASLSCLHSSPFTITQDATMPMPMCGGSKMDWFGEQTYYVEEKVEDIYASEKKDIHLWKESGEENTQNKHIYAFLAWERLDLPFSGQNVNGTSWNDRILHAVESASKKPSPIHDTAQKPFEHHNPEPNYEIAQMQPTYAIIRMNSLQDLLNFSMHLQRDTRIAQLTAIPKSEPLATNVTLPKPKFNPPLHALLFSDTLDVPQLREDARILSGEDEAGQWIPSGSLDDSLLSSPSNHWHSRHSATQEARLAGAWIRARLSRYLAPVDGRCIEWTYDDSYAPNIVCTIPVTGTKKET